MSSVLGATGLVLGNVQGQGDFEVRGRVQGDIVLAGRVLVSAGGVVLGTIEAVHISISGTVRGDLIAEDGVEIAGSGQVEGNVTSPRVAIEAGAKVRGHLRTGEEPPAARRGLPAAPRDEPSEPPALAVPVASESDAPASEPPAPRAAAPRVTLGRDPPPAPEAPDARGPGAKRRRKRRRERERNLESQAPPTDAAGTNPSHVDDPRPEPAPERRPTRPSREAAPEPSLDGGPPERPRRAKPLPTFVKGARGHLRG